MAAGQHKAIAVRPQRLIGIVVHRVVEQLIRDRSQRHRRARVAAIGGLNRIHAQGTNGVNGHVLNVFRCNGHQLVHSAK